MMILNRASGINLGTIVPAASWFPRHPSRPQNMLSDAEQEAYDASIKNIAKQTKISPQVVKEVKEFLSSPLRSPDSGAELAGLLNFGIKFRINLGKSSFTTFIVPSHIAKKYRITNDGMRTF